MKYSLYILMTIFGLAALWGSTLLASSQLIPNLVPFAASDLRLETVGSTIKLRFSTTGWNNGAGPVELAAGETDSVNGRQNVYQRIYVDDGTSQDVLAGQFVWHEGHNHFHFEDYALYTLQPIAAPGGSERVGNKTTFCVMDTTRVNTKLDGAPKQAHYDTCGSSIQGMSVGWGDTYGYNLAGQEIDITGLPDGDYRLTIELDPKNKLVEADDADNISSVDIRLAGGTVSVIGGNPGRGRPG